MAVQSLQGMDWLKSETVTRLHQALDRRARRQVAIAENVAAVEVPGAVSRDIDFAQSMRAASEASKHLRATHAKHLQPTDHIGRIVAQGDPVRVGHGLVAAEEATLVDAQAADTPLPQSFCQ